MSGISENIRKYRKRKGIKQAELGVLLGRAATVISNWESGVHRPDVASIEHMCEIFEIDPNTLFGWQERSTSHEEAELLDHFRQINSIGRDVLIGAAKGLAGNEEYKKDYLPLNLEKEA